MLLAAIIVRRWKKNIDRNEALVDTPLTLRTLLPRLWLEMQVWYLNFIRRLYDFTDERVFVQYCMHYMQKED